MTHYKLAFIGFGAAGVTDVSARFILARAEKSLGQSFVITNNGGGGGSVAYGIIAQKPPDGYNLVAATSTGLVRIPQFRTVPYHLDDFTPIMHYAASYLSPVVVLSTSPWKTFRELVDFARKNPPNADYVLYADYVFTPQNWEQGFLHFVVCDRKGEWVIVDMQNSHHPDYQSIGIISRDRCDQLLVKRLAGYLK